MLNVYDLYYKSGENCAYSSDFQIGVVAYFSFASLSIYFSPLLFVINKKVI